MGGTLQDLSPPISHLFFADNSYFFFKACPRECNRIRDWLGRYERASEQRINLEKSTVAFSPNVTEHTKSYLCTLLGMADAGLAGKYLGVPAIIG